VLDISGVIKRQCVLRDQLYGPPVLRLADRPPQDFDDAEDLSTVRVPSPTYDHITIVVTVCEGKPTGRLLGGYDSPQGIDAYYIQYS
jgi:hypothetical protein